MSSNQEFKGINIDVIKNVPVFATICSKNMEDLLDGISSCSIILMAFSQAIINLFNIGKLKELLLLIENDWKIWTSEAERKILCTFAETGRVYMIYFAGHVIVVVGAFVGLSMTPIILDFVNPLNETRPKQVVYPVLFWFNHQKYINYILVHGSLTAMFNVTMIASSEGMYTVITHHVCALFAIISYRLKNIETLIETKKFINKKDVEDELYKIMSFTIERHCYAIKFANALEAYYSPILLYTIGFYTISASVVGIQTLISLGELYKTIKFGIFAIGLLFHLYCLSLPAQKLIDCSQAVVQNVCEESWYQMPIKVRKLLIMIIMRGHVPCKLTAGKFYTVDMIAFSSIVKAAVSYFTVLSSMR